MSPDDILNHKALALTEQEHKFYFEKGLLKLERSRCDKWLNRLCHISDELVDRSRRETKSGDAYDLGPSHSVDSLYVRRLKEKKGPASRFLGICTALKKFVIATGLVEPDLKFCHGKLNYKHPGNEEIVQWHQDIPTWAHTNYSPVTIGIYLYDAGSEEGLLTCIRGSHKGQSYSHY